MRTLAVLSICVLLIVHTTVGGTRGSIEAQTLIIPNIDWYDMHWLYRKCLLIGNTMNEGSPNQILLIIKIGVGNDSEDTVYLDALKIQPDFDDVRMTGDDGVTTLDYWIEEKVDHSHARMWVDIQADVSWRKQAIYLYYGNPDATSQNNGANMMMAEHDFKDNEVNTESSPSTWGAEETLIPHRVYIDTLGYTHIVGEIQNRGTTAIEAVKISVTFVDEQDRIVMTDFTFTELQILRSGDTSPFDISSHPVANLTFEHYALDVTFDETDKTPYRQFIIANVSYTVVDGYFHVRGEVENVGTINATRVKVLASFYYANESIITYNVDYVNTRIVAAGARAFFDISTYPSIVIPDIHNLQVECAEFFLPSTITCLLATTPFNTNIIASGAIIPERSNVFVTITYFLPNATIITRDVTTVTNGSYRDVITLPYPRPGIWRAQARWLGDAVYTGATSLLAQVTVAKVPTEITCTILKPNITIGDSISFVGHIQPRISVPLTFSYRQAGTTIWTPLTTVTSTPLGDFNYTWVINEVTIPSDATTGGVYQVLITFTGNATYETSTTYVNFTIVTKQEEWMNTFLIMIPIILFSISILVIARRRLASP